MTPEIIKANVTGKKIKFDNGICWDVEGANYKYGWAYVRSKTGKLQDITHAPEGFEIKGNVVVNRTYIECDKPVHVTETVFQPHDGIITDKQAMKWDKAHWIMCFGNDDHFYNDVESVTYKDPKTGKPRKDKCYGISIQHDINVIVYRKNGRRPTMSIPIQNVTEKHLKK